MTLVEALRFGRCKPCSGGAPPLNVARAREYLAALPAWRISGDGRRIRRNLLMKDFTSAVDLIVRIKDVAEAEGHHPDIHLTEYRRLAVELWTHAIGGLSENDFILAAKIEDLPKNLQESAE
jgi:4a-hydroxytetrahydrobiopterin dehydratase